MSLTLGLIVFRDRGLAVAPHGLLGCQDEWGEAGQRLGQLQEWMLQTDEGEHTRNIISWGTNSIFRTHCFSFVYSKV